LKKTIVFSFLFLLSFGISAQKNRNLLPNVNPFVGTAGHGHTFPGACYPFGMMQLSPDTRLTGWDGCSGYHYSDSVIYGFTHTHLSGTGCSDWGDILLMPVPKLVDTKSAEGETIGSYTSSFSHKNEKATPGYYSVVLNNGNIKVELTVGRRAGIHRYTYPKKDSCIIVLDLQHRDEVIGSEITFVSDTEVSGYRRSKAWAKDQRVYFDIRFSKPIANKQLFHENKLIEFKKDFDAKNIKIVFGFKHSYKILVKVGISGVSAANAALNLTSEIPAWDFEGTLHKTEAAWNDYLNRIQVSSKDKALLTTFYSALYHTAIHPSLYTDVNGQYLGRDFKMHVAKGYNVYTVFSLWDTYRAEHPLMTLIEPSLDGQFIQTFLRQYEQGGNLPIWELSANETKCMIGYHSVPVIVDAYMKGIRGFDVQEALKAMEHSADARWRGLHSFRSYGYIPADKERESVSKTLEYSYDDWCISQFAKAIGKKEDYMEYKLLAENYKNLFDPSTGFMRAKSNGAWYKPFDPSQVDFNYTEANAWQYTFNPPDDVSGLIELYGSKARMAQKLDSLFIVSSKTSGRDQADISGMIGQYAQGNEPSHHMAFLFNYLGMPWKTAEYVRQIEAMYSSGPDGLCGNEDCGQMSAWYVLASIGIYQVCPGDNQFILTSPLFDTVKINMENGKTFSIISHFIKPHAKYINAAKLNGTDHKQSFIPYEEITKGGTLNLEIGDEYSDLWGTGNDVPEDSLGYNDVVPEPYFQNGQVTFSDSVEIAIKGYSKDDTIHYAIEDSGKGGAPLLYGKPFYMHNSGCVMAWLTRDGKGSMENSGCYVKIPKGRKIRLISQADNPYTSGGPGALIDYQHGTTDFGTGNWEGFQGKDFEAIVDLGKVQLIKKVGAEFLQDVGSWIMMPKYVDIFLSTDSINYNPVLHKVNSIPDNDYTANIQTFGSDIAPQNARYVKVFAKSYGKLPAWHEGAGGDSWVFIDEITVE
jgi:predicted alpha-1,2-mannosidase